MRPGYDYILASPDEFEDLQDGMTGCAIECSDIRAIQVSVPSDVSAAYIQWLRIRNLELARTIRVWPAGLPGRNWDGEGRSEWLTTEKPCFGIVPGRKAGTADLHSTTSIGGGDISPQRQSAPKCGSG